MRFTRVYKRQKRAHLFTSINITPLTDIALVLLIIFMIATPLLIQSKIKINLPKVETENRQRPNHNIIIFIDEKGHIYLDDKKIEFRNLKIFIKELAMKDGEKTVTLNGDKDVRYDAVVQVLNLIREMGIEDISLGIEIT
ncbi:MAG: biopolymer transporter ExbD [bacterium]|nr:biopolymer transporter ExbD [bacterium]